jgi:hypothetical protein
MVNGLYSGLDYFTVGNSVGKLNALKEKDFPNAEPGQARLLAEKGKPFVSAVLLFSSNSGPLMALNPTGPALSETEFSTLNRIFQLLPS